MGPGKALVRRLAAAALEMSCLMLWLGPTVAAEDVLWVNELDANPKLIGQEIVVEGRFSGVVGKNRDQIKLQDPKRILKVEFHVSTAQELRLPSTTHFVRLTGTLTESEGKLIMQVKTVVATPVTDRGRYEDAARRIGPNDYQGWYDLAQRTRRLAEFYSDNEVKDLAQQAMLRGFQVEEAQVKPAQAEDLLVLADRVDAVGLRDESRRMRHKALRWRFTALSANAASAQEWDTLASQIAKLLPGAHTPAKPGDAGLVTRYVNAENPSDFYGAHPGARDAFEREFWIVAVTRRLLAEADQPSADLVRLSEQAKQLLPDRSDLSRQLLEQWAEGESQKLANLRDSQVRKLAQTFRTDLGKPERADALLRQWLDTKRNKLGKRDAEGRYQLARQYRLELRDHTTAANLLSEALSIEPEPAREEEVEELKASGFVQSASGWSRSSPGSSAATAEQNPTPRDNLPKPDMTSDQVRQLLGDPQPEDRLRFGTAGQIVEQWVYRGPPDIYVTFRLADSSTWVVVAVRTHSRK